MKKLLTTLILILSLVLGRTQSLEEYIELGIAENPSLKASYLTFEAAMTKAAQVNALPDPTLSFGYFISPVETRVGPQQAKLSLTQMFPWFGTLAAKNEVESFKAQMKYQDFMDQKLQLILQIKEAYYPIVALHEEVKWHTENIAILESYQQLATTAFSNGKSAMTDVLQVDIRIKQSRTELKLLEEKLTPMRTKFNLLLNRSDSLEVVALNFPDFDTTEIKQTEITDHPLLLTLTHNESALVASETLARKNGSPNIGVGLDYVFVGKSEQSVSDNGKDAFMPMVTMSLPIFRKKHNAAINEAQILQTAVTAKKEATYNALQSQLATASYSLSESRQRYELFDGQIELTQQVLRLLYTTYGNNGQGFDQLLSTQQQILNYEIEKTRAMMGYHLAKAQLDYLTSKSE